MLVDPDAGALTRVADELGGRGARVVTIEAALDEPGEARRVVQVAEAAYGGFDTVVISPPVLLAGAAGLDDRRLFDRLYWSVADCATEAARHLRRRGGALVLVGLAVADPARRTPVRAARGANRRLRGGPARRARGPARAGRRDAGDARRRGRLRSGARGARGAVRAEHPRRRLVVGACGDSRRARWAEMLHRGWRGVGAVRSRARDTKLCAGGAAPHPAGRDRDWRRFRPAGISVRTLRARPRRTARTSRPPEAWAAAAPRRAECALSTLAQRPSRRSERGGRSHPRHAVGSARHLHYGGLRRRARAAPFGRTSTRPGTRPCQERASPKKLAPKELAREPRGTNLDRIHRQFSSPRRAPESARSPFLARPTGGARAWPSTSPG